MLPFGSTVSERKCEACECEKEGLRTDAMHICNQMTTPEPVLTPERRQLLEEVLIYHWRRATDGGCGCGWGDDVRHLGRSWPKHIIEVYEESVKAHEV